MPVASTFKKMPAYVNVSAGAQSVAPRLGELVGMRRIRIMMRQLHHRAAAGLWCGNIGISHLVVQREYYEN